MTSLTDRYLPELLEGPRVPLAAIPSSPGGSTGVFTIWYRDQLLGLGRSTKEPAGSGNKQADGLAARLRMVLRQPHESIQRALAATWPEDLASAEGATRQQRASDVLKARAECRLVRLPTGAEAQQLYDEVLDHLRAEGLPLADRA